MKDFASLLRAVRYKRGVSQQALAEMSGISRSQIRNLEGRADPQLSTVCRLAQALEVPPALLLPVGGESAVATLDDVAPFPRSYVEGRRQAYRSVY